MKLREWICISLLAIGALMVSVPMAFAVVRMIIEMLGKGAFDFASIIVGLFLCLGGVLMLPTPPKS